MAKQAGAEGVEETEFVSDSEVDRTIALVGGDEREAVRALLYTLHTMVARAEPQDLPMLPERRRASMAGPGR